MLRTRPARWFSGLFILTALTSAGEAHAGGALFEEVDDALTNGCGAGECWTNHLRVSDLDGDGDLDIVLVNYGGFFSTGDAQELVIYENDGGVFTDVSNTAIDGFEGRIRQVAIGDVDADGDLDIFAPDGQGAGSAFFINMGDMVFADEYVERMPEAQPNVGATRMGDFDNDGDLDIFSADGYTSSPAVFGHIYLNDGLGNFDEVDGAIPDVFTGQDPDDVDLLDANGDFVTDILLNAHNGDNSLWLGNGDGTFSDGTAGFPGQPHVYHYNPGVCDVDGDGDLDVWVDNQGPSLGGGVATEQLLINDGSGVFVDETSERVSGNPNSDDNGVVCADIDNDGDFDGVVIALGSRERYLENDGSGNFTLVNGVFGGVPDASLWGEFGDLNGDGRFDLVTGQGEFGDIEDHVYFATNGLAPDDRAPLFRAIETGSFEEDSPIVIRSAISDRSVTDNGPRLSTMGATLSGDGVEEATAVTYMGGDLFRAEFAAQPAGAYAVEICVTDVAGNEGCETTQIEVGDEGGESESDTGGADETGAVSTTDTDGASDSDSDTLTASTSDSDSDSAGTASDGASATASATATAGDTDGDTDGDSAGGNGGGGGCSTGGPAPLSLLLLGPVLLGFRRRRD
ncbi:MAG: VCBS repeat-containing protein [Nannocystaceae bacterium]|nr:VCBS repeat-containing protein [Nannocystaceae bacterium]